jgi:L-malate glycosyltransferase
MKILHIIPSLDTGGAEKFSVELSAAQKALGHEIFLCCLMRLNKNEPLYLRAKDLDIPVYYMNVQQEPRPFPILRLSGLIKKISPDVVQSHLPRTNPGATIASRLAGVKCVIATHHNSRIWKTRRQKRWGKLCSYLQDGIFCDSKHIMDRLLKKKPKLKKKCRVIFPGSEYRDLNVSDKEKKDFREKWSIEKTDKVVGTISRLVEVKDLFTFIDTAEIILKSRKDIKFIIIGTGPYKDRIKKRIAEKSLEKNVIPCGFIPSLDHALTIMDIFTLTSISEGLPISILEAFNAALPVVSTNAGGVPEIVIPGENGFLAPLKKPDILAKKIMMILNDKELREKLSRNAKASAKNLSIENCAENTTRLYKEFTR